jgi:hypothetical protein
MDNGLLAISRLLSCGAFMAVLSSAASSISGGQLAKRSNFPPNSLNLTTEYAQTFQPNSLGKLLRFHWSL